QFRHNGAGDCHRTFGSAQLGARNRIDGLAMIEFLNHGLTYIIPFLVILTVLVFVHEFGHYLVARWNGVRVEVFSIGFGPELFGRTDRAGTRWKFSALPFGGYVKMFGEVDEGGETALTEEQRSQSFAHKRVGQRAAIVVA